MKLPCLSLLSQKPKANSQKHRCSFLRLTPYALLLTALAVLPAFSQQTWQRTYGWGGFNEGRYVQQTQDGGYIIAGTTDNEVYLIKTNASGDTLWTRTFGDSQFVYGDCAQQTSDGGYIVAGGCSGNGGFFSAYLVKTNASGDSLWTRTYRAYGEAFSVQQTTDGGYIITGATYAGDAYLIKTDASGDSLWTRTYGGASQEYGRSVRQTTDGGYIVAGYTYDGHAFLIKTDPSGDTIWTRTFEGAGYGVDDCVQQTSDGGYIVADASSNLIKTNAYGDSLWAGFVGDHCVVYSVQQTSDGGYIAAGYVLYPYPTERAEVYLIKTDTSGIWRWSHTFHWVTDSASLGYSVQQTSDGGYIIAGSTSFWFDWMLPKIYVIKTDSMGGVLGVENNPSSRLTPYASRLTVSPNPFASFAAIPGHSTERFALYDISGRRVGTYKGDRIGEGLPAGVYFLRTELGGGSPLRVVKVR